MFQFFLTFFGLFLVSKNSEFFNEPSLENNLGLVDPCLQKIFFKSIGTPGELFQIFEAFSLIQIYF